MKTKTIVRGWVVQWRRPESKGWSNDCGDLAKSTAIVARAGVFRSRLLARDFIAADRIEFPKAPLLYRVRRATVTLEVE
jgi:hypothetical protein